MKVFLFSFLKSHPKLARLGLAVFLLLGLNNFIDKGLGSSNFLVWGQAVQKAAQNNDPKSGAASNATVPAPPAPDQGGGKWLLKADVGYVYNFGGNWQTGSGTTIAVPPAGGVGYGVSLGWTHPSGFGLSVDYLHFDRH